jgi:hypothetical protein
MCATKIGIDKFDFNFITSSIQIYFCFNIDEFFVESVPNFDPFVLTAEIFLSYELVPCIRPNFSFVILDEGTFLYVLLPFLSLDPARSSPE